MDINTARNSLNLSCFLTPNEIEDLIIQYSEGDMNLDRIISEYMKNNDENYLYQQLAERNYIDCIPAPIERENEDKRYSPSFDYTYKPRQRPINILRQQFNDWNNLNKTAGSLGYNCNRVFLIC